MAPATPVAMPVETPAPTAQAKVVQAEAVVEVVPAPALEVQPKPAAAAPPAPVSSPAPYAVSATPVASLALGTIRGVTIIDNNGALERKGPPPTPESLGDAARRLKKSKQQ
ncbi:MAG TPA: hypothetical protein VLL05_06330 [Terriglobales bacterium]|nr:hypothetical protein [Terriglobales bacterium]